MAIRTLLFDITSGRATLAMTAAVVFCYGWGAAAVAAEPRDAVVPPAPTSTEPTQSPLDESFGERTHAEWVRETRRQAWNETTFDVVLRSYYLSRDNFDDTRSEAWALGGWAGFKTGYFRERFAFGATAYTSQSASGDEDKDGTLLLAPGQHSYSVLGELYGELLVTEKIRVAGGRLGFDTPYINRIDNRMTPNTFEALMLRGLYGGGEGEAELRFGGGYVGAIKTRNSDRFDSMSQAAGAPDGVDRGVYVVGANYRTGGFSIGAINYYSDDIINIFYSEAKYAMPVGNDMRLQFAAQFGDQRSTGAELLRGTGFSSHHWGVKGELAIGGALFTTAYTTVSGDTGLHRPWGASPGYTLVQVDDFSRDGEDAWMLRAGYTFQTVKGLGLHAVWVNGSDPDPPTEYAHDEYNLDVQWTPPEGGLKGLQVRLRYSLIEQDDPMQSEQSDFRVMVFYSPPSL